MNHGVLQGFSSVPKNTIQPIYGAGIVTDPRMMPISVVRTEILFKSAYNASASLWTAAPADLTRLQVTSDAKANIVAVTGSGFVTHIITPGYSSSGATPIFNINVDGNIYIIKTSTGIGVGRLVIGSILYGTGETATTATFNSSLSKGIGTYHDSGHIAKTGKNAVFSDNATPGSVLPSIAGSLNYGLPKLRFEKYLSIDIASTGFYPANQYDDSAYVGYVLD